MSIRYRLAAVLALIVLPVILGVGLVLAVMLPARLASAQTHGLDVAARSVGSAMTFECGALGYRAQIIALSVANGQDARTVLAQQGDGRPAGSYDAVRVGTGTPVTRGTVTGDPTVLPGPRCSTAPGRIDTSATGRPLLVEQATVATTRGPITVTSVELITPDWVRAAKETARISSTHVTVFCATGSATGIADEHDVVWREAPAQAGQPCIVRAGESEVAGERFRFMTVAFLAAVVLVSLLLLLWLANELTSPIVALSHAARRATDGERDVRLEMRRSDEIGELADDFDTMVAELHRLITDAERGHEALKDTSRRLGDILRRTHDLDGMLTALCALAETTAGGAAASVWMTEGSGLRLRTVHPVGSPRPGTRRVGEGESVLAAAAGLRTTQATSDATHDAASILHGRFVALPLVSGDNVLGVIAVERAGDAEPFTDDEVERLELAVGSAGIAVDNAILHRAVQRQSVVDPLTGVGNLRSLTGTLGREIERGRRFGRPVSVMVVDIDDFTSINTELGPSVGDGILKELAAYLSAHVRSVDTVARYGGEEFAVVCPELGPENALRAGQRLVDAVRAARLDVLGIEVPLTVSVGVACYPADGASALELIGAADDAMAHAKAAGRDRVALA